MKQKFFDKIVGIVVLLLLFGNVQAQTLVNKEWEQLNGIPDSIAFSASVLDNQGNLIVTSNAITAGQQANLLVMKYDKYGNLLWQDVYNGSFSGKDYGVAVVIDSADNVFVAGASQISNLSSEIIVRKYDTNGVLEWTTNYGGSGGYNAAVAITLDNVGNIFVTGVTSTIQTQTDYITLKFDANGIQEWVQTYNYANLYDVPVGIEVSSTTGNIYVTGASASSNNNYDYATIEYDITNGNQLNVSRISAPGTGFDKVAAIKRDDVGNLYITGSAFEPTTNSYDIKTIKLNASLVVQWIKTFDKVGLEDAGTAIDVDNSGNVLVGGYVITTDEGRNFITLKYDANGNELWNVEYNNNQFSQDDEIQKIAIDNNNEVYVTGKSQQGSDVVIVMIKYDTGGNLSLLKIYENGISGIDVPNDIETETGGNVYVTGKVFDGVDYKNAVVKYSVLNSENLYEFDSLGVALYLKNQIIIGFDSAAIQKNTIDNLAIQWGTPDRFLKPYAISQLANKLNIDMTKCKLARVHKRLTTQINYSISRLGDTIQMPPFWATLIFMYPSYEEQGTEIAYSDSLKTLFPLVEYAHLNAIAHPDNGVPNDPFYVNQTSLYPSTSLPASNLNEKGINVEKVWDEFGATGESFVKVGIFDTGTHWQHEDFNYLDNGNLTSKVQGWDFEQGIDLHGSTEPEGNTVAFGNSAAHGTNTTGIIGALRNNTLGVSGIAGGDNDPNTGVVGSGVSLYAMKIRSQNASATGGFFAFGYSVDYIMDAITISATYTPNANYGYGLHVMNHSWGIDDISPNPPQVNPYYTGSYEGLSKAIRYAYKNDVTTVASRGNKTDDRAHIPATYHDDWVLNVTGSGSDGDFKYLGEDIPFTGDWQPNWGKDVDLTAPCSQTMIQTTDYSSGLPDFYGVFLGTSASAPHVAGSVSLLMSYFNPSAIAYENLAPEDVEYILEHSAVDDPQTIGYDDYNGHGRTDIYAAFKMIEKPYKDILHFGVANNIGYSPTSGQFSSSPYPTVNLTENYKDINGQTYQADVYIADIREINVTVNHNIPFPFSNNIIDFWARNGKSNLLPLYNLNTTDLVPYEKAIISSVNSSTALLKGYCYRLGKDIGGGVYQWDGWIPFNPLSTGVNNTSVEYSVYVENGSVSITSKPENTNIQVYPNPATTENTLHINCPNIENVSIDLYDIAGKKLQTVFQGQLNTGENKIISNIKALSSGFYMYHINGNTVHETVKFIKY